jgi:peroxiredoxin (alkyl hydroperoxide reductase subunit C)
VDYLNLSESSEDKTGKKIENQKLKIMKKLVLTFVSVAFLLATAFSQTNKIPLIGSTAPSFTAETTNGQITFPTDYGKKWKILFSHPQDFTPVCSSELSELAFMQKEFEELNTQIAIISTDDVTEHKRWKTWLEGLDYKGRGPQKIEFPIIDDQSHLASLQYGMLHTPTSTNKDIRGVYIIDPNNIVRSINFYPMQVGRNMQEIERILIALQTADRDLVATPANWKNGDDVIVPHYPYTDGELAANPKLKDDYYNVGGYLWFKKANKTFVMDNSNK